MQVQKHKVEFKGRNRDDRFIHRQIYRQIDTRQIDRLIGKWLEDGKILDRQID